MSQQQQLKPQKKRKPVTRQLPFENANYERLMAQESRLDYLLLRKRLDIQEALNKTIRHKRTLRMFISNQAAYQIEGDANGSMLEGELPSWTLKIEGRLLQYQQHGNGSSGQAEGAATGKAQNAAINNKRCSHFIKMIVVELMHPDKELETIVWRKQQNQNDSDGFEIKRLGQQAVPCKIHLYLDYAPEKYKLSAQLSKMLNLYMDTKASVIMTMWQYIKAHRLQDAQDPRTINCDDTMQQVFGVAQLQFPQIPELIAPHLSPCDPISIDYEIRVLQPLTRHEYAVDIEVEVDDFVRSNLMKYILSSASQKEVASLDAQVIKMVSKIQQHLIKRDFMADFATDPVKFINQWIESQALDLSTVLGEADGDAIVNKEVARRSAFYREDWVAAAVWRYLTDSAPARRQ